MSKLSFKLFGIIPVADMTIGTICTVSAFQLRLSSMAKS